MQTSIIKNDYQYGWNDKVKPVFKVDKGLNSGIVKQISQHKKEPNWMEEFRLKSYETFKDKPLPNWGPDLSEINFEEIYYYLKPTEKKVNAWENVPPEIRTTYEKLGIPQAERKFLAGVTAQFDSEMVYGKIKKELADQGVIFLDTDSALKEYPELFREYFGTVVPYNDNKFAALNSSVWSGGSFIYVPKGLHVKLPLQAYFRINASQMGQFERTLIIADEGSFIHYIEGCTSPVYSSDSLHAAVVEIFVKKGARCRYTTVQNWSKDVYNLNTKRSIVEEDGIQEWVGGSLGSKTTMLYPCTILMGKGSRAEHLNIAVAGPGQHKDTGAKVIHLAPYTSSNIVSKSISFGGGISTYRGLLKIIKGAKGAKSHVQCDALMFDDISQSNTIPYINVFEDDVSVGHEAKVGRISEEQVFYLMNRGLKETEAINLVVQGFMEPVVKTLPLEYAVELNRLIALEMTGSVG